MALQARWTDEARIQLSEILTYWNDRNRSSTYSNKLLNLVEKSIERLMEYPEIGRPTENERIRLKIVKDYFIYYSFDDKTLILLGFSDMRRNPDYLKSFLKE